MMPEQQNIEYKTSWHDEYLKWICGFANAQGGRIYIDKDDSDLRFQEVEEGNLIILLRNVVEQLNRKFLIRPIEFEGMYRIEKNEYPVPAIREMLLNALIHRTYMGSFIQIGQ